MNVIKQIIPLPDNMTPVERTMNDDGTLEYFDCVHYGTAVFLAVYDDTSEVGTEGKGLVGFVVAPPYDYFDVEEWVEIVPTRYCPECRNRMEAYTGKISDKTKLFDSLKYRCRLCDGKRRSKL